MTLPLQDDCSPRELLRAQLRAAKDTAKKIGAEKISYLLSLALSESLDDDDDDACDCETLGEEPPPGQS